MSGNGTDKTAPRAPMPPGMPRNAQEAAAGLAQLRNNPEAMRMLQQLIGGQQAPQQQGGMDGPGVVFAAIANCVNSISQASERTAEDLSSAREKIEKLELELTSFRKQKEAEAIVAKGKDESKRTASRVLEKALLIANEHGGNKALSETMVALANETGIELNSDHLDALEGATTGVKASATN